jgi:hypothetical protein
MAGGNETARTISLGDDFGDVVVVANGRQVKISADGVVSLPAPANDSAAKAESVPEIGKPLADGWIYLGTDPETGEDYSLEPAAGAIGVATWYEGEKHAADVKKQGHRNAHQPTEKELNDIFNKIVKGCKNDAAKLVTSGSALAESHWSSTTNPGYRGDARMRSFSDGFESWGYKGGCAASVRVVRSEPRLER